MKLVDVVNETIRKAEERRAKLDKSRLGKQITCHSELNEAAQLKQSVACPHIGSIHPASWVLNMNYSCVCHRIAVGLYVYKPKGGTP